MPNRMLREGIVDSRKVALVSDAAKVLLYKLLSVVDDFGRFEADPELLRRRLYIWEMEHLSTTDVIGRLNECSKAGLVNTYSALGKPYLEIVNFRQQIRAKSKFPDANGQYTAAPKDGRRAEFASSGNLCADDRETKQSQADALVPTRIDSTRIDPNRDVVSEGSSPLTDPSRVEGTDGWDELIQGGRKAGMSLDPEPSSNLCQKVWRWMNSADRKAAVDGIRDRIECGEYDPKREQFTPTLENYLNNKKWRNSLRPRRRDSPNRPNAAGALRRLVEAG